MASKYQKRHYEDVARLIADIVRCRFSATSGATAKDMEGYFAAVFAADNPNFDRERFLKACGLDA